MNREHPSRRIGRCALAAVLFALALWLAPAARAMNAETKAFTVASKEFSDSQFGQAEADFTAFLNAYSNSVYAPKAVLGKAQAQMLQSNYSGAISTLQEHLGRAGELTPDYIFYIAKSTNALGDYRMAATGFSNLLKAAPDSRMRMEASYDEAAAWSKLRDWPRVQALLSDTNGAFQRAARTAGASNQFAAAGLLLLSQAYLEQGQAATGEDVLRGMTTGSLGPEWNWERQLLLCKIQLAQGKTEEAEANTTNLIALTETLGPARRAESVQLRGEILQQRGQWAEALQCYTNNLADDHLPPGLQRAVLAKAVDLMLGQAQTNAASQLLESLAQRPGFAALDLVRLDLGELLLAASAAQSTNAAAGAVTNLLERAGTNFASVISDFPDSPARGRAQLDYGWRFWLDTNFAAARTNFAEAVRRLPHSEDQAVARFKLADADMAARDFPSALSNYDLLLADYAQTPSVTNTLFDLALYKILEAGLAVGDEKHASEAAARIFRWFPASYYSGPALLLYAQDRPRKNDYAKAREEFRELALKQTPLRPEADYAIARTWGLEGNWPAALPFYDQWVSNYTSHPLRPRVEFDRALAYDKAGQGSNALTLMTNFVARYASNNLAPWAQNWVADYYFNLRDFQPAEQNYEELYVKWPNAEGDLPARARFMAGKSALGRGDLRGARDYFSKLVSDDQKTPPSILNQACFALGDTIFEQFTGDKTNTALLDQAIAAVSKLTNGAPTNAIAALAFGRLGDFYLQGGDPAGARQMYQAVLACAPDSLDTATRSRAEIGLGNVADAAHQPKEALQHFDRALYDPDQTDPYWISQAGTAAAAICEQQGNWAAAIKVYQRVLDAAPALRPTLEKRIALAQRNMDAGGNSR